MSNPFRPHVGLRSLKTAAAAVLCALGYALIDRNPTFACIGAIFGLGPDMAGSRLHGGNRLFGTMIGGFLGMGLFWLYLRLCPARDSQLLLAALLFAGVLLLILLSQVFWEGAVQPGGVVLCILLYNTPPETYVEYSLNRMLDTGVGVAAALLLNWLLPRRRLVRWRRALAVRLGRLQRKKEEK